MATAATLLVFVAATRPGIDPDEAAMPTTVPPLLSAVTAETIDLTTPPAIPPTTTEWEEVSFKWPGQIAGTLLYNGSLVAYGWDDEGARAWLSGSGAGWREVTRLEVPESAKSSIEHAVVWEQGIVALGPVDAGVGSWTARALSAWTYQGQVPDMEGVSIVGLVAGPRLLALAEGGPEPISSLGWVSDDGLTWTPLGPLDALDELMVLTMTANDGWYFAGGTERCETEPCRRAAIFRSRDGITWERTSGPESETLTAGPGVVLDIAASSSGLLAVGLADGEELAIWQSPDGAQWNRVAADEPLFQPIHVLVHVHDIDLRGEPFADVQIGDARHRLVVGSEVRTDAGAMRVTHVGPTTVGLEWEDGSRANAPLGDGGTQTMLSWPHSVAVQGPRIVITGHVGVVRESAPAVWYSTDYGQTWIRQVAESWHDGRLTDAIIRGDNIVATGLQPTGTPLAPLIWHSTWDTSAAEADGIEFVQAFVDALNVGDVDAVAAAVPKWRSELRNPTIELPTLGRANAKWWDSAGVIDVDAIGTTLAYLDELNTTIEIESCTSRFLLGEIDRLQVSCGFHATSDLMEVMSYEGAIGKLDVSIESGVFEWATLSASPSEDLWQYLTSGTVGAAEADRSTIVRPNDDGQMRFDPTFDAQSAAVHLRLADKFTAGLLRPGETKVVDTPLGTMEWQWIQEMPVAVYTFDWITSTESGFVALGHGEPGRWTEEFSLWFSTDGVDWEEMPTPTGVQSMWGLQPFGDGLVARGYTQDRSLLLVFDGDDWSEIAFPTEPTDDDVELMELATSGDKILALTGSWIEDGHGLVTSDAWLIGADRVPRRTALPPNVVWTEQNVGLVGSDEGFVLATSLYGSPRDMSVWHSADGRGWTVIAESASIDDAAYVWNFQHHFTEFFVVGEGAETRCTTTGEQGQICQQLFGLWSSPDGTAWDQVLTTSGEPLAAHEMGSGPLGMAAVAMDYYENKSPRPIYLSPDGRTWDRAGNLALLHPDVQWWWISRPAVGRSAIIIPGAAYDESAGVDSDVPFLIVGRLVDL